MMLYPGIIESVSDLDGFSVSVNNFVSWMQQMSMLLTFNFSLSSKVLALVKPSAFHCKMFRVSLDFHPVPFLYLKQTVQKSAHSILREICAQNYQGKRLAFFVGLQGRVNRFPSIRTAAIALFRVELRRAIRGS